MDIGAHLNLDDGHDVVLVTDVKKLSQGAGRAGIGDTVTLVG